MKESVMSHSASVKKMKINDYRGLNCDATMNKERKKPTRNRDQAEETDYERSPGK